jgi:hypothetical protein
MEEPMKPFSLAKFFEEHRFTIPSYQRDFAWENDQIEDLLNDLAEVVEYKHVFRHFLGTFILRRRYADGDIYDVVDGQQRLTAITMLAHALHDDRARGASTWFVARDGTPRLTLSGDNQEFFTDLISGKPVTPTTLGQRRLCRAFERIKLHLSERVKSDEREAWVRAVAELEVVEVEVTDEGDAVRMFHTLNDRGKSLSEMEKTKSLLVSYSNRFLDRALDEDLNRQFGTMFRAYDDASQRADGKIPLLKRWSDGSDEDEVLGSHATTDPVAGVARNVADGPQSYPLRRLESMLRKQRSNKEELEKFIKSWVKDLNDFFAALVRIVEKTVRDVAYHKLLCVLDVSNEAPELLMRLEMRGLLDAPVPNNPDKKTFRDLVETVEMRLYKTGSHPQKHADDALYHIARDASPATISADLRLVYQATRYRPSLQNLRKGRAAHLLFLEYEEERRGAPFTLDEIRNLRVDRVLSIHSDFDDKRGFGGETYPWVRQEDDLGNLTLIEKEIEAADLSPEQKASSPALYPASKLRSVDELIKDIQQGGGTSELWGKANLETRTSKFVEFGERRWPLWK